MPRSAARVFLVALAALNLLPLLYMLRLALWGPAADATLAAAPALPLGPFVQLAQAAPLLARWLANSLLVAGGTVLFHLLADSMAGFVLAKRRFRGQRVAFVLILLALMVPRQVTLIPLFLGMARAGLADTLAGLILPGLADVIGIFMMRQFFVSLPDALLEAARIDGAGEWALFLRVALPLSRPALGVLAVLGFQHYWSDFFWPLVITQSPGQFTIQVGLAYLVQSEFGPNLALLAAGACTAALPMLLLFLLVRKQFFAGLRAGALK